MPVTELVASEVGTSSSAVTELDQRVRDSRLKQLAASFLAFGLLAATSTGLAAVSEPNAIIGHESTTSAFAQRPTLAAYVALPASSSAAELLALREESGLTWDQIARLFGVSRRAVHHWASGDNMNAHNFEVLSRIRSAVSELSAENAADIKTELLRARVGGSVYDALRRELTASGVDLGGVPISLAALLGAQAI